MGMTGDRSSEAVRLWALEIRERSQRVWRRAWKGEGFVLDGVHSKVLLFCFYKKGGV